MVFGLSKDVTRLYRVTIYQLKEDHNAGNA